MDVAVCKSILEILNSNDNVMLYECVYPTIFCTGSHQMRKDNLYNVVVNFSVFLLPLGKN